MPQRGGTDLDTHAGAGATNDSPSATCEAAAPAWDASPPLRILILEDRAMDADLVVRQLRRSGFIFESTVAVDEPTYLAALARLPDVILADYSLPQFGALRALRHLHDRGIDVPFIVVTGTITEETAVEALRAGAADYLLKDRLVRLPDAVRRALADREARQRERLAAAALRESEARYRTISELTSDFAYAATVRDDGTLHFAWITDAVTPITGYTADELQTWADIAAHVHPEDRVTLQAHIETVTGGVRATCDCRVTTRDGDERVLRFHSRPEIDPVSGRVRRLHGAAQDVTEHRRSELALQEANQKLSAALSELQQTQQQMVQQERLKALGDLASGIAHDFNNALTMILGFSELMLAEPENYIDGPELRQNLGLIKVAAQDAASIVRRLGNLYREREQSDALQAVDLHAVVSSAIDLTEPRWNAQAQIEGKRLSVEADVRPGSTVLATESDLRELLTNLIINAVDACRDRGQILVCARPDGDHVLLEVSDDGLGMTDDVRLRCLEPFFTTKKDRGTGLGLPMVFGIVQRYGGSLSIDSASGEGTTFEMRLPRAPMASRPGGLPQHATQPGPWNVLVVDDEEPVRTVLRGYLLHGGHHGLSAASASEALGVVATQHIDLVVLDRVMPEMSGDRLATRIRQISPSTRILMLSGIGPAVDDPMPDVDGAISKPVRLDELLHAVSSTMAMSRTRLPQAPNASGG